MFEAVLGLSRVQTCFSPSLIHCHGTVWREAGGSCQLIHWEFDQKPRATSGSISWLIAAVPYQINFVSSNIAKLNCNKDWNISFQKWNWISFAFFVLLKVNSGNSFLYFSSCIIQISQHVLSSTQVPAVLFLAPFIHVPWFPQIITPSNWYCCSLRFP